MKRSPIEAFHKERDATFIEDNGWCLPAHFGDPSAEYRTVRSSVGWIDLANRCVVSFSGPDTTDWLQGMLSNDIKILTPGTGTHAAVLNIQGKILADVQIFRTEDAYLMDLWEPIKAGVLEHLGRYLVADDVEVVDRSEDLSIVSIQGPDARATLAAIFSNDELPTNTLGHEAIPYNGGSLRVIASSHTGEEGFNLFLGRESLQHLLTNECKKAPAVSIPWIGLVAQQTLRIEAGVPHYGVDMSEATLLLETNLDEAVSFTKGCYLGQEVVERIHSRGHVNKKLVGIQCRGDRVPDHGDIIESVDHLSIGVITSATLSPHLTCPVALGYVNRECATTDHPLVVHHNGDAIPAVVASLPFYSRS